MSSLCQLTVVAPRSQVLITQDQRQRRYFKPLFLILLIATTNSTYWRKRWMSTTCNALRQTLTVELFLPEHEFYKCQTQFYLVLHTPVVPSHCVLPSGALCRDATSRKESPGAHFTHTHTHTHTQLDRTPRNMYIHTQVIQATNNQSQLV